MYPTVAYFHQGYLQGSQIVLLSTHSFPFLPTLTLTSSPPLSLTCSSPLSLTSSPPLGGNSFALIAK